MTSNTRGPMYLIRKAGYYYRPNSQGYTTEISAAGLYTLAEAERITHPNGPDGPRDEMSYELAPPTRVEADQVDYIKQRIAELVEEGDGFWRPCSGCQESCQGYVSTEDYPYSEIFRCQPGGGCGECGGIGVIWDDTDYEDYARFALLDETPAETMVDTLGELRSYSVDPDHGPHKILLTFANDLGRDRFIGAIGRRTGEFG
ncbi:hypothetical protein [Croceicoccus gelatinilyticus]|uniref:hypothetical protein n=1 Tax=Croceicoccus gelatinilyticus TaxID=2835536 RepID=UPI001BCBCA1D|nr:hypothetical protein [Croceicoccus gelatinilyticus]MBS7669375.1 hypothetical protein [Croceicoccus gelatinilyticus]